MTTPPVRARSPQHSRGSQRARRTRSHGVALLLVAGGALLGWALPLWERHVPAAGLSFDSSTAQATLAAIAGGMITLAGFVVTAITLVVQTVQTMSPRLVAALGHFSRYLVLFGLLIGTALYALVTLSHVRGESVPRMSVTVAVGLVLVDAVTVLYLLASLRHAVTGGGLARAVGDRLRTVIDQSYPAAARPCAPRPEGLDGGAGLPLLHHGRPAVVYAVDEPRMTRLAARYGVRVRLLVAIGDFVGFGTTVARIEAAESGASIPGAPEITLGPGLARRVFRCVRFGPSRTVEQDTAYGFRLLADIAVRSLSPAVNDPTTAVQALDQIEDGLLRLADRPLGSTWLLDRKGRRRVSCPAPHWPDLVSLALDETILYGYGEPQIVRRLRALLERLVTAASEDRKEPVAERLAALERLSSTGLPDALLSRVASRPDGQGLGGMTP
ncbi:DUF2254 family protein [Streptomyces sp. NPDC096205]|uniref:DUF2254 family protein n=1 Tax=Streptomyces sp. NPDC096205 TaxID=3366081 RepID=UPI00380BECF6